MFTKVVQIFNETYYFIAFCLFIEVREPEQWISPSGDNEKKCMIYESSVFVFIINFVIVLVKRYLSLL